MDELKIEYLKLGALKPYKNNARKHKDYDVKAIAESIKAFGFNDPIGLWSDDNIIVEGHGRLEAAKMLGMEEVPCIRLDHLSDEQRKAYALAHNRTAELSAWDEAMRDLELTELVGFDMTLFGFDKVDDKESEIEEAPMPDDANVEQRVKSGDVWKCGQHRLMCGSSTNDQDIQKLMAGETARIIFTSPPYSDMRDYRGGKDLSVNNLVQFIKAYKPYTDFQCVNLGIQRKNDEIVEYWDEYIKTARENGLKLLAWNVWDKLRCGSIGQQKAMVPVRHEWIFVFGEHSEELNLTWKKKKSSIYQNGLQRAVRQKDGSMKKSSRGVSNRGWKKMESIAEIPAQDSLESVTKQHSETGKITKEHPATFPIFLPAEYIIAFTDEGEGVIEPFGGSGTTMMACEQLGRRCFIMELDPHYCDVILARWEEFTGKRAELVIE